MKKFVGIVSAIVLLNQTSAVAETGIERWERMQQQMAYEDILDRQREKHQHDQMELEGLRSNQNRIIQPATCVSTPIQTGSGNTIIQKLCK